MSFLTSRKRLSITFDMILDAFSADGFKGVKKLFQDHKEAMANATDENTEDEDLEVDEDDEFYEDEVLSNRKKFSKPSVKLPKVERRKTPKKKAQFMNSAMKEVLLKKFELGEDDEYY